MSTSPNGSGRTIVLADRIDTAVAWCRANGVPPFGRRTILATRGPVLRGFGVLTVQDRVIDLGGAAAEVYADLELARLTMPST